MDDAHHDPTLGSERTTSTAEKLRALREKLSESLDTHRRRATDIEQDLDSSVHQIAEELARDRQDEVEAENKHLRDEVAQLQTELATRDDQFIELAERLNSQIEVVKAKGLAHAAEVQELQEKLKQQQEDRESNLANSAADTQLQVEAAHLRQTLSEKESELAERAEQLTAGQQEADTLRRELDEYAENNRLLARELEDARHTVDQLNSEFQQLQTDHQSAKSELESTQAQLEEERSERESLRTELEDSQSQRDQLQSQLEDAQTALEAATNEQTVVQGQLDSAVAEHKLVQTELTAAQVELEAARTTIATITSEQETTLADLEAQRVEFDGIQAKYDSLVSDFDARKAELDTASTERDASQAELQSVRDELHKAETKLNAVEQRECPDCAASREELAKSEHFSREAEERLDEVSRQYEATCQALEEAQAKSRNTSQLLTEAEGRLQDLTNSQDSRAAANQAALAEVQAKFDLALDDVQKLRKENAELRDELANRPASDDGESPALVSLRAERDALAAKVEELERVGEQVVDEDLQQQLDDLQKRFEMAVDDVRELKQENSELKERLASSGTTKDAALDDGCLDWQAQKARLLALLENEDDEHLDEGRREERTTIEGTIAITDNVVAAREREIEELKARLAEQVAMAEQNSSAEPSLPDIFDQDEVIQAERERLEKLEGEWKEKLRQAELEMSIQRAALSRKECELQHKLEEIQQAANEETRSSEGKPRRRWLSALGLRDDDEDEN